MFWSKIVIKTVFKESKLCNLPLVKVLLLLEVELLQVAFFLLHKNNKLELEAVNTLPIFELKLTFFLEDLKSPWTIFLFIFLFFQIMLSKFITTFVFEAQKEGQTYDITSLCITWTPYSTQQSKNHLLVVELIIKKICNYTFIITYASDQFCWSSRKHMVNPAEDRPSWNGLKCWRAMWKDCFSWKHEQRRKKDGKRTEMIQRNDWYWDLTDRDQFYAILEQNLKANIWPLCSTSSNNT